jgi:putative nucleotidyltransferase with HDIG domain
MALFSRQKRERTPLADRAERVLLVDQTARVRPATMLRRREVLYGVLLAVGFLVFLEAAFVAAVPGRETELEVGQVARQEIAAPYDFDVLKPEEELTQERAIAEEGVAAVFRFAEEELTAGRQTFGDLVTRVYGVRKGPESQKQKLDMLGQLGTALSDTTRSVLLDGRRSTRVEERAREILYGFYERGILKTKSAPSLSPDETVILVRGADETMVRAGQFLPDLDVAAAVRREAGRSFKDRAMVRAIVDLVVPFATGNVFYDSAETERRKRDAREGVSASTGRDFKKNEIIVQRGERITSEHLNIVRSMIAKRSELVTSGAALQRLLPRFGRVLLAGVLLFAFALYLAVRRKELLTETRSQLFFLVLVAAVMAGAAAVGAMGDVAQYLVPITVLSMLLSMLFGFELAVVSTFFTVILASIYTGYGTPFAFVSVVAGVIAAYSVRRVREREDFYWSALRVVGAYAVAIAVSDASRSALGGSTAAHCALGGLNAVVSMGVVVVVLPLFETAFRVTTEITLLELGDMNRPLLRKMAMMAPGTYHHSIIVGNLAEAAAEAIHADGLLARVGSYYHDIGKLVAPGYFVENQQGLEPSESKHAGLRPKVSSLVIRAHVRDGIELARKERLPEPIVDIVSEHHGASVMEYFYNKALEEADDPADVQEEDFRYPGPRPRSKESAIISLADVIEARVRAIGEPMSSKRIEAEVEEVIEKRWSGHELDDAELTLSDLAKIREAFSRVLTGMYHQRIKYPDQDEESDSGPAPNDRPGTQDGD